MSGPTPSTSAPPATISEATLSQRPRTRRPLRRSAPKAETSSSSIAGAISAQRPASQTAIGIRKIEVASSETTSAAISERAEQRADAVERQAVGARAARPAVRGRSRRARAPSPPARGRARAASAPCRSRGRRRRASPLLSPPVWTPRTLVACRTSACRSVTSSEIGSEQRADPDEERQAPRRTSAHDARGSGPTRGGGRRGAERSGATSRAVRTTTSSSTRARRARG